jgi:hypothetical protein
MAMNDRDQTTDLQAAFEFVRSRVPRGDEARINVAAHQIASQIEMVRAGLRGGDLSRWRGAFCPMEITDETMRNAADEIERLRLVIREAFDSLPDDPDDAYRVLKHSGVINDV